LGLQQQNSLDKGWKVIATMRTPDPTLLPESDNLTLLPLDITSADSIDNVVKKAGAIDLLVNNAGFGAPVPVELTPLATAQQLMNTNVLGTLALTQAFLPLMREKIRNYHQCFIVSDNQSNAADWALSCK
jgi:NAD(P)-dependent dehydrogenase (short-subunit alcohol dehydrogenase family)